jgi:hypothetical protein
MSLPFKLPTASQLLAMLFIGLFFTLPLSLVQNAVTGWIDGQIASYFGWGSPSVSDVILFVWQWIVPFGAAALVLFIYHVANTRLQPSTGNAPKRDAIQRIKVDPVLAFGILLVVIGFVVFAVRTSNISSTRPTAAFWKIRGDTPPPQIIPQLLPDDGGPVKWARGYLIWAGGDQGGLLLYGIQATGTNTSEEFIGPLSGYVRSEITGQQFPILNSDTDPRKPIDGYGVPAGNQFHLMVPFNNGNPMRTPEFLRDFGRITFVFQYGDHIYSKRFVPDEIEKEVSRTESDLTPKPQRSVVGLKPMTQKESP